MQNFNPATAAEQVSSQMIPRLDNLNLSAEEYQEDLEILQEFNKIAAGMLNEEPGIEMPGNAQPIPLNEKTAMQGLSLFSEGLYLGITKCLEMGITGDVKKHLLQNLAMEVYSQAKQVVASTYGQEHTPDYQFTHEQQVEFICQGAESALMFFISEYEREYGAIAVSEPPARLLPKVEQAMMEDGVPLPDSIPASAPQKPKGPTPHDKYGAVALLLTTLPADQRARIFAQLCLGRKRIDCVLQRCAAN